MMQFTLLMLTLITSLTFMQMNHPLAMGLILLIQTVIVCLASGLLSKTFWFSYILFLVFLGGMLVLFIYVTSLASNEMFSLSMKNLIMITSTTLIMGMMIMVMDKNMISLMINNLEMKNLYSSFMMISENTISLNKLYNYPTNMMTLLLINYLLITLIAIVKITNIFYGPLRMMN